MRQTTAILKRKLTLTTAIMLCAGFLAPTAAAQERAAAQAPDDASVQFEEIVVLGERFGSGLSRATFAVSAQDIEERPLGAEITQALAQIPGVQVSTGDARGGSFSFELYLRGLSDEQIGFSIDGIPTGDSRFNGGQPPNRFVESSNVSKIVVSQSAGDIGSPSRFALGGFIEFQTDDPKDEFGAELEAGVGSFDYQRYMARVDFGEILPGLTGYTSFSDQSNDNYAGPDSRSKNRQHFDFKLVQALDNGSTIKFRSSYNYLKDNDFNIISLDEFNASPRSDRAGDVLTGVPNVDVDFGGALGGERHDWLVYLNADLVLSDTVSLKINPYLHTLRGESYRYQNEQQALDGEDPRAVLGYDETGGAIRPDVITTADGDTYGGPADLRVTPRDRDRYGVTAEVAAADVAGFNTIRIGGWYESNKANELRNFYPLRDSRVGLDYDHADLRYVEYERESTVDTLMLYAQDQMALLDGRLKLDIGLTYYDIQYDAQSPLEYQAHLSFSQASGIQPKVGLSYDLGEGLEVFAGYAQNFGGLPEDVFLGSSSTINPDDLAPVETDNFDLGLRYVKPGLALSLQGYMVDLKNNIGIVPTDQSADVDDILRGNAATRAANLAGTETWGIEATAYMDFGTVDLYATYAYQHAYHDDAQTEAERIALAENGIIAGERIRDIPTHSAYVELGWQPTDNVRIAANASYTGKRVGAHYLVPNFCNAFFCFDNDGNGVDADQALGVEELPSHTLLGINAKYSPDTGTALDALTFHLNIDNLLDETFVSAVSGATATLPEYGLVGGAGYTLDRYFIGYPRTVTFSVSAKF